MSKKRSFLFFGSVFTFVCLLVLLALCPLRSALSGEKKDDFWAPMQERVKIWDAVVSEQLSLPLPLPASNPYIVSSNGLEATFEKGGAKWTIVGANAAIVNPTVYPKDWPVKGDGFEVLVIPEPITNYKILPFTEKIENAVKSDTISITGAADSYEPASFVIRSGDVDLKNVIVEVTDLKARIKDKDGKTKTVVIPRENIDIRIVKCWYQAGVAINDTKHKLLTPELLLHDDDVVRVDYDRQVDLLRNLEKIQDAEKLKTFIIPKKQNKQIWLTAHVTDKFSAGRYQGTVKIITSTNKRKDLKLEIEVLPFTLPEPMLDYALYYEGYLSEQKEPQIGWRPKTEEQMLYELRDMKEHGLTNATVWHQVASEKTRWGDDWKRLKRTLELRQQIGWGTKSLLYLDWKTLFSDDLDVYKEKTRNIVSLAQSFNIREVYIYGKDEGKGYELLVLRNLYHAVHEAGAKNFVACTEDFIIYLPDLLDLPVLHGNPNGFYMTVLNKLGIKVWNYGNPQAGLEEPETYRRNYGIQLLKNKFSGVCDYVYQHGGCWNDFADKMWRSHTMAYPSVNKPIPTVQWEGWRKGVNDVRYLTLMKNRRLLSDNWLSEKCRNVGDGCRKSAIELLSESKD